MFDVAWKLGITKCHKNKLRNIKERMYGTWTATSKFQLCLCKTSLHTERSSMPVRSCRWLLHVFIHDIADKNNASDFKIKNEQACTWNCSTFSVWSPLSSPKARSAIATFSVGWIVGTRCLKICRARSYIELISWCKNRVNNVGYNARS